MLGYVAREISDTVPANLDHFSAPSPARTTDKKLQAVDYARLSAAFRGVCLRLHARLAALEAHLRPQSLNITRAHMGKPSDEDPGGVLAKRTSGVLLEV